MFRDVFCFCCHNSAEKELWSFQMMLLVCIAALDSADKSLLAASFPIIERTLHLNMASLGYFSLYTNLSYALCLPFWGWLLHRYTLKNAHNILSASCLLWGIATLGIAATTTTNNTNMVQQAIFRSINGAALASILPLSQTMLVALVPSSTKRGRAFGLMGCMERAAATLAVASVVHYDNDDWTKPYRVVGIMSIVMSVLAQRRLQIVAVATTVPTKKSIVVDDDDNNKNHHSSSSDEEGKTTMTLVQIVNRIVRIPAFLCLVAQGVFGAIPWDMQSFLLLLLRWKGFTNDQIVVTQFTNGISGTIGGVTGGVLGDVCAATTQRLRRHTDDDDGGDLLLLGRIVVAIVSVVGGMVFYGLFLFSNSYTWTLLWSNAFHLWGSWTPACANRPLCADLARNPSERAQIVATWILMEKTSAALFGAPLVGYITKHMLDDDVDNDAHEGTASAAGDTEKAEMLAFNIFCLSSFFWTVCAAFWLLMAYSIRRDRRRPLQPSYEMVNRQNKISSPA